MNEKELLQKKKLVDKFLKKKKYLCLLDALFYNVDGVSVYIRLDYNPKNSTYKIDWINLSSMEDKRVEHWINSNLIYPSMVDKIKGIIASNGITKDYNDNDKIDSKVIINSYLKDYECNRKTFEFHRYIPKCWKFLADLLLVIFDGMPKYLFPLFQITVEKIIIPDTNCVFNFDLKKDDIDKLFNYEIIQRGKKYYDDKKILFLEKTNDCYNSIVEGSQKYLVSIINKDKTKEIQMTCNCPCDGFCKHIYATLLAIKNKEEHRFYKIANYDDSNIMDTVKNFNYLLCVDIVDDCFIVVDNFTLAAIPILKDNKLTFKVLEDDEKKTLEKKLNKCLKKYQK